MKSFSLKSKARDLSTLSHVISITVSKHGRKANQSQTPTTFKIWKLYKNKIETAKKDNGPLIIYGGLDNICMINFLMC